MSYRDNIKADRGSYRDDNQSSGLRRSGDSPALEVASLEAKNKSNERLIAHLNVQVEYLQKTNQELELRIRELEDTKCMTVRANHKLEGDVDRLHAELRDIDSLAQQMEAEKKNAIKIADQEIHDTHNELRDSKKREVMLETKLLEAEEYQRKLMEENEHIQEKFAAARIEIQEMKDLMDKIQDDKKLLSDRISTLSAKEKTFAMELERHRGSPGKARRNDKGSSKLDSFIRTLENERDYYKNECDVLNTMLRRRGGRAKSRSPTRSSKRSKSPGPSMLPASTKNGDLVSKATYQKIVRERDELLKMLDKFENHTAEIEANVRILSQERDRSSLLYEQANEELERMRRKYLASPAKASLAAQTILHRVEKERDTAITDLRRMAAERDSIRETLQMRQEQAAGEKSRLEHRLNVLETKIMNLEDDKLEMQAKLNNLKGLNAAQDEELNLLRLKLQDSDSDRQSLQQQLEDIRMGKAQVDASLEATQRHLNRKSTDLSAADDRIKILESRVSDLLDSSGKQNEDISKLRATVSSLDRDKDEMQAGLEEKLDRINNLEDQLSKCERENIELKLTIGNLESKLECVKEELENSDREARLTRRDLDDARTNLSEAIRAKDAQSRETRRLQDDCSSLTRENQDLNTEIDDMMRERDEERNRSQDLLGRLKILEGDISAKEKEIQDVCKEYNKIVEQRDNADSKHRRCNDELNEQKIELISVTSENKRLADKVQDLDQEIIKYMQTQNSLEAQISDLRNTVHRMESDLRHAEEERKILVGDISTLSDIKTKSEVGKDQALRQLDEKSAELDELKSNFEDLTRELNIVHKHLDDERINAKKLENAVSTSRDREFQSQLESQESKSETQMLKDKLLLTDSKLQSVMRELSSLRNKTSQLETELETCRRHLTNERYERERAVQELHRHGLPSPGLFGYGSSSPKGPSSRSGSPSRFAYLDQ